MTRQVQIYTCSCHEGRFSSEDVLISALCSESRDSSRMSTGDVQVQINVDDEPYQDSGGTPDSASGISARELVASWRRVHVMDSKNRMEPDRGGTALIITNSESMNKVTQRTGYSSIRIMNTTVHLSPPFWVPHYMLFHRKPSFTSSPEGHINFDEPEPDHG